MAAPADIRAAKRTTYMDQVLAQLQAAGPRGMTTADLCNIHHRFSATIFQLRARGWAITTIDQEHAESSLYILDPSIKPVNQPDLVQRVPPARPSAPPVAGLCDCGHVAGMHRPTQDGHACTACVCTEFKQQ